MLSVKWFFILVSFLPYVFMQPGRVFAQAEPELSAKVLITELQTESDLSANDEFVELTNISTEIIDFSGWVIQYRSATGTSWQDKALLSGSLYIGGSIVVSTQGYNVERSTFFWTSASGQLAATGGNIRILAPDEEVAEDTLAWGTGIFGEGTVATKATKGKSLHRKKVNTFYEDTSNNSLDFYEDVADPINLNIAPEIDPEEEIPEIDPPDNPEETPIDTEVDDPEIVTPPIDESPQNPDIEVPSNPSTLLPIVISELMVNPASPELDSTDEWVELYNPNPEAYDLKGYKIQTGSSYSYTYLFVDQLIQPFGYLSLSSGQTNLALSNTSGAVRIVDDDGQVSGVGVTYEEAEEGSSYAVNSEGLWVWTTTPTRDNQNIFTVAPVVIKPFTTKKVTAVKASTTKASTKVASAKSTATKASAKTSKSASPAATQAFVEDPIEPQKTRPLLLATFAIVAVLYGVYEYRDDITNSMWRARRYIATWRKARQGM